MPLTRREFIKIAGAGAGALVAASTLGRLWRAEALIKSGRSVSRTTGASRQAVPSFCLQCPARCSILGYIEEGYLVKIEGNPRDPNSRGGLCAKGLAGINHLYNPDRLLFPLKRAGARGERKWRRITWDEALEEVAAHLKAIQDSGRSEEFVFMASLLEGTQGLVGRFLRAFGTPNTVDEMALYQGNKETVQRLTWGAETEVPDLARTRLVLNFGANPYESHSLFIPLAQRLVEAQMRGARLVTLDPRLSNTAARSDQWLPLRPGTDAAVALALAHVILRAAGGPDSSFLRQWTNYPEDALARHLEQVPFVTLMQPAVAPLGESRPMADVFLELGQRLDLGPYLDFASAGDYVRAAVAGVPGLAQAGGLDHLKESGVWFDPNATPGYRSYETGGFATPSGKFQVHLPDAEFALPEYRPSPEAGDGELPLITFQFNVHTYGRTAHCQWLSEIVHDNPVWVNPETARELGIERGDGVRLTTALGSILARAWVTQAVRPGVLAMGSCVGRWGAGRVAQAQRFKSSDPNTELLWWEAHGNGVHPHRIMPVAPDPVGGGQGWKDTLVKVEKA